MEVGGGSVLDANLRSPEGSAMPHSVPSADVAANDRLLGLHRHLFCEANPIPVKWAVQQLGLIGGGIRLPMTPLSASCHEQVRAAMTQAGLAAAKEVTHAAA